jgi:uncharacterized membrane protein YeaQ/YmgE (transglycosylase-associated protein family)
MIRSACAARGSGAPAPPLARDPARTRAVIFFIVGLALGGLIIGGLGRLLVPGPNPIGFLRTIVAGLAGSFLGGLVARLAIGMRYRYSFAVAMILAVVFAALFVYLFERSRHPRLR